MKKLFFLLWMASSTLMGQIKIGDPIPEIEFNTLLNGPAPSAKLSKMKGKVVVLEFWATWCGSCIAAMPHLKALQNKYPSSLQIIAVNDESVKRTNQFLKIRPQNYWFAVDTARTITKLFPHQMIPHTIVVSPEGILAAVTSPEAVTEEVIAKLLAHQKVELVVKKDNTMDYEEIIEKYFHAEDSTTSRFIMEGNIEGAPGLSTTWLTDSTWRDRRFTCLNLPLTALYRMAHVKFSYYRIIDQSKSGDKAPKFCVDLIVKNKKDLMPTLHRELAKRFDLQTQIVIVNKEVQVLTIVDQVKFNRITRNTDHIKTYYSRHGDIDQHAMTMRDFADFLENFGLNKITIDETKNQELLDIKFSWQPEDPNSIKEKLAELGLGVVKAQRPVDILVIK